MIKHLKQSWGRFKAGLPGRRFQQQFRLRQRFGSGAARKALFMAVGILIVAAGIFLLFVPGPGIIILLIGAVLIAQQSSFAARAFDRIEIRLWRFIKANFHRTHRDERQ
ncbi:MAG TPA: PGPGW domain-containing protein [Candidatus Binatia bacterium]|nr:PGPGW domain-containing protein [Candidatus Binatia bacterium]